MLNVYTQMQVTDIELIGDVRYNMKLLAKVLIKMRVNSMNFVLPHNFDEALE